MPSVPSPQAARRWGRTTKKSSDRKGGAKDKLVQAKVDANAAAADARAAEAAATTDAERRAAAAESRKRSAELKDPEKH